MRLPVSLITGFLGSGKTTLIAGLLRKPELAGTAVIVNEFAGAGIDDLVLASERTDRGEMLLLRNGCICCTSGDDLTRTIMALHGRAARMDNPPRLLIETTGLADPVPLLHRLMRDLGLRALIRLAGVVAVVDGLGGSDQLAAHPVSRRQAGVADRRVVTKADLAPAARIDGLVAELRQMNPGAPVIVGQQAALADPHLLDGVIRDPASGLVDAARWLDRAAYCDTAPAHAPEIGAWTLTWGGPITWTRFEALIRPIVERGGRDLLRSKGLVWIADVGQPVLVHGVRDVFHRPVPLTTSTSDKRESVMVFIGHARLGPLVEAARARLPTAQACDEPG